MTSNLAVSSEMATAGKVGSESRRLHCIIFQTIGNDLPTGSQEFQNFYTHIELNDRDKQDNAGSAEDLLRVYEKRGHISVGDYTSLLNLLDRAELINLRKKVEPLIQNVRHQLTLEGHPPADDPVREAPTPPAPNTVGHITTGPITGSGGGVGTVFGGTVNIQLRGPGGENDP